jgi:protoheme IX farnesyltransferase
VAPITAVTRQILVYSYTMVVTSLLLWPVAPTGVFYPTVAVVLGAAFLVEAHRLRRRAMVSDALSVLKPMRLFHASNLYLALLFAAVAVDSFLH